MISNAYIYQTNGTRPFIYSALWGAGNVFSNIATEALQVILGTITDSIFPASFPTLRLWVRAGANGNSEIGDGGINGHRRFNGALKTRGINN